MQTLTLTLVLMMAGLVHFLKRRDEHCRIALLNKHLGKYQIEELITTLTEGYMNALEERDPVQQHLTLSMLSTIEKPLCEQFDCFAKDFALLDADITRSNKLPVSIFFSKQFFRGSTFDFRAVLGIHAHGINQSVNRYSDVGAKDKAYTVLAELYLMQHSCHWFCKTKFAASRRLLLRNRTAYAKVLSSVMPTTRDAYTALVIG